MIPDHEKKIVYFILSEVHAKLLKLYLLSENIVSSQLRKKENDLKKKSKRMFFTNLRFVTKSYTSIEPEIILTIYS